MMLVVPNYLAAEINALLDAEIAKVPDAAKDRDVLYSQILEYVNDHGVLPQFSLVKRERAA